MRIKGSAEKRQRQSETRQAKNRAVKSVVRTQARKALEAVGENTPVAEKAVRDFSRVIDNAVRKGVVHWKTAARRKSRMDKKLSALAKKA